MVIVVVLFFVLCSCFSTHDTSFVASVWEGGSVDIQRGIGTACVEHWCSYVKFNVEKVSKSFSVEAAIRRWGEGIKQPASQPAMFLYIYIYRTILFWYSNVVHPCKY